MGKAFVSKTLKIKDFGSERCTFVALRAWSLHRAALNGWYERNEARRRWAARASDQLAKDGFSNNALRRFLGLPPVFKYKVLTIICFAHQGPD
jgi:hypothetical protein